MITINMVNSGHTFDKENTVTLNGRSGYYDIFVCKTCGLRGESYMLGYLQIKNADRKKITCPNAQPDPAIQRVRVTLCTASGRAFVNLTPGSEHDVVDPPAGESASGGVWVMGVGEPVKLLDGEYVTVDPLDDKGGAE